MERMPVGSFGASQVISATGAAMPKSPDHEIGLEVPGLEPGQRAAPGGDDQEQHRGAERLPEGEGDRRRAGVHPNLVHGEDERVDRPDGDEQEDREGERPAAHGGLRALGWKG